jgi:hypothetical protein
MCALGTMAVACSSPSAQPPLTATAVVQADSPPHFAVAVDMLLVVEDLASLPGSWCCDTVGPLRNSPDDKSSPLPECSQGKLGWIWDSFVSDEPQAPGTGLIDGTWDFSETILEFRRSGDAAQCMDARREAITEQGSDKTLLSFPVLGDETVALTVHATPSRSDIVHLVAVRRENLVLLIGASADDRTLSYVTIALAKIDRLLGSATPTIPTTTPTP